MTLNSARIKKRRHYRAVVCGFVCVIRLMLRADFSEWAAYPPERQRTLLVESCREVTAGKMPGPYTLLHPETKLSAKDIETICAEARK